MASVVSRLSSVDFRYGAEGGHCLERQVAGVLSLSNDIEAILLHKMQ